MRTQGVLFLPGEARGALPNGTRIVKALDRPGDTHRQGDGGVVMSSHPIPADALENAGLEILPGDEHWYFVEWDDMPGVPVGIRGSAIRKEEV